MISKKNINKRYLFAKKYINNDLNFFRSIIFSDETTISAVDNHRKEFAWTRNNDIKTKNIKKTTFQKGKFSITFWGCFSFYGKGPLVAIDGNINFDKYINILQEYLLPEISMLNTQIIFQQDNAPPHVSKKTMKFFNDNTIDLLDWPASSPDIAPIENIWGIIKKKLYENFPIPKNKNELINNVFKIWDDLEPDLFEILAEEFPQRLSRVINNKGNLI